MTIDTLPGSLADAGAFIIIGGAGGIGGTVARRLRSRHAAVLIAGRTHVSCAARSHGPRFSGFSPRMPARLRSG